ncbi:MAG: HAD family hydrolase, partial [Bacilli bacterium]|nr:HAD family hydrolase [Bacilli bacterium]
IDRPFDFLTCSSADVSINGDMVRSIVIPSETIQELVRRINDECHPAGYLLTSKKHNLIIRYNLPRTKFIENMYLLYHKFQFKYREEFILDNDAFDKELVEGEIQKMMIFFGLRKKNYDKAKAINKELRAKYPDAEFSWSNQVIELTPKNCNKGDGLEYYCNVSNISKDNVYVVGDSGNDIAMFNKFHEHSYCMAHSYPSVKKYAKHIISRVWKLDKLVLKGEKPHESN